MDDVSVSKGVFAHRTAYFGAKSGAKPAKKGRTVAAKKKKYLVHKAEPWYSVFTETRLAINSTTADVNANTFRQLLIDLRDFVVKIKSMPLLADEIPTGILLAGINVPDHDLLLKKLVIDLETVTPYIATVWSRDSPTLKNLIEEVVYRIINYSSDNDECIRKINCTFCALNAWHQETNNGDTPLIIIIPDFESFCPTILHDFILILSSYLKTIKFVLIFGVATTLHVVHRSLSYDATSKLKFQVFHMQDQVQRLSDVLDGIILSPNIPFKITGRAFELLVDIFLWYDFSVDGFLKSYMICMWKHFYNCNEKILCCKLEDISDRIAYLNKVDLEELRTLPSVKNHLQSLNKKKINDSEFKELLTELLEDFHEYMNNFLVILKCLYKISLNLPGFPFGKTFREIYISAVGKVSLCETPEYKNVIRLIGFFSKEEILSNIKVMLSMLNDWESASEDVIDSLKRHYNTLENASLDVEVVSKPETGNKSYGSRTKLLEDLKLKSQETQQSPYKRAVANFMEYLDKELFRTYLKHPRQVPINEVFCYSDADTVKRNVMGSTKASIYSFLMDPHIFFENDNCCTDKNVALAKHLDINIVYTLHLENRKMINMYDWLQAFLCIVDPNRSEEEDVDPVLHARFTRAVAELQILGFIKATRRKTDHVKRLTV